ncbi:MAG: guanylate kinase [Parasphingorhabdus sp.]
MSNSASGDSATNARLVILSAPSGAGKTSLARALIESSNSIKLSVSHTTRAARPGENDGQHYHFVDHQVFEAMIAKNEFLEYAEVFGNYYGTSLHSIEQFLGRGLSVILDIDWQGARKVRQKVLDVLSIFLLPPSLTALRQRLKQRGQDSDEVIENRMRKAMDEMEHYREYDYVIINEKFEATLDELIALCNGVGYSRRPDEIDVEKLVFIEKTVTLAG